jgi:hypothetical protein
MEKAFMLSAVAGGTARTAIVMGVEIFGWFRFEVFLRRNELAGLDGLPG